MTRLFLLGRRFAAVNIDWYLLYPRTVFLDILRIIVDVEDLSISKQHWKSSQI